MNTSQRINLFTWKCLQDTLLTKKKLGFQDEERKCVLCQQQEESTSHLFFECHYVKSVWKLHPMPSQGVISNHSSTNTSFLDMYNEWMKGDLNSIYMALAATKC